MREGGLAVAAEGGAHDAAGFSTPTEILHPRAVPDQSRTSPRIRPAAGSRDNLLRERAGGFMLSPEAFMRALAAILGIGIRAAVMILPAAFAVAAPPEGAGGGPGGPGGGLPRAGTRELMAPGALVVTVEPSRALGTSLDAKRPTSDLQGLLSRLDGPVEIQLMPGHYDLAAFPFNDLACIDCDIPSMGAIATAGLRVRGRQIKIIGAAPESVFIHTNAGYGILFDECDDCVLRGVTITDGVRDGDPGAVSAAVVVRNARVKIEGCAIRDNLGDATSVAAARAGVGGIAAREGSEIEVKHCRIVRNSGDGIALYETATAEIHDNLIDGVDRARGPGSAGGAGVGVALAGKSSAKLEGNFVTRYWKGIGVFGEAHAQIERNVVEDVFAWGISCRDDRGAGPVAFIRQNAIHMTGSCGAALAQRTGVARRPGAFAGNAVVKTGQGDSPGDAYGEGLPPYRQIALDDAGVPAGFEIRNNIFHANREAGGAPGQLDLDDAAFRREAQSLADRLAKHDTLRGSSFVRTYSKRLAY
ncbi:MAG: right-handed parallel beta-helix repeat-containing protein [bacterium]